MKKIGLIVRKIFILCSTFVLVLVFLFNFPKDKGYFSIGKEGHLVRLPYLVKFAALIERETYYKVWLNEVIGLDNIESDREKIIKVFNWINNWIEKDLSDTKDTAALPQKFKEKNVVQHEYYALIKQYDERVEKANVFYNLMAVAGYQASQIYEGVDWEVVVNTNSGGLLCFDFLNKKIIEIPDKDKEKCRIELRRLSNPFKKFLNRRYLWGDLNLKGYTFLYYIQKALRQRPERIKYIISELITKENIGK